MSVPTEDSTKLKLCIEALERVNQMLTIPAAEYVPAIPEAWKVIEETLAVVKTTEADTEYSKDNYQSPPMPWPVAPKIKDPYAQLYEQPMKTLDSAPKDRDVMLFQSPKGPMCLGRWSKGWDIWVYEKFDTFKENNDLQPCGWSEILFQETPELTEAHKHMHDGSQHQFLGGC